jgi:hypothetical protein
VEGTWVLPPGWTLGVSNLLERVRVKPCKQREQYFVQLRPGDQFLSKGGRWSIDFFVRPATPYTLSLSGDGQSNNERSQASQHSHYSQLERSSETLTSTVSAHCLHRLLELDEPRRAICWLKATYECDDAKGVKQTSVCRHYKATFGAYGALLSPLIVLKAVKSAFSSSILGYGSRDEEKYIIKGIRQKEGVVTCIPEEENLNPTSYLQLSKIQFDLEYISPAILQGMETPAWKVIEDSQAARFSQKQEAALSEDPEDGDLAMIDQVLPVPKNGLHSPESSDTRAGPRLDRTAVTTVGEIHVDAETERTILHEVVNEECCGQCGSTPSLKLSAELVGSAQETVRSATSTNATAASMSNTPLVLNRRDASKTNEIPSTDNVTPANTLGIGSSAAGTESPTNLDSAPNEEFSTSLLSEDVQPDPTVQRPDVAHQDCPQFVSSSRASGKSVSGKAESQPGAQDITVMYDTKAPDHTSNDVDSLPQSPPSIGLHSLGQEKRRRTSNGSSEAVKRIKTANSYGLQEAVRNSGQDPLTLSLGSDTIVVDTTSLIKKPVNKGMRIASIGSETSSHRHHKDSALSKDPESASQKPKRSQTTSSKHPRQYSGDPPVVVFSSSTKIESKKNAMTFLRACGGKPEKNIGSATMLCVGANQPLAKTAKLVLAICLGLDIVTDKWLVDGQRQGFLLDTQQYLPKDAQREREWGFRLDEALERGRREGGLTNLLAGTEVHFTQGVKILLAHNFRDFTTVATCSGADAVRNGLPKSREGKKVLIVGMPDDPQTLQASRLGHDVWSKDLLVMAALRGVVERTEEFIIARPMKEED